MSPIRMSRIEGEIRVVLAFKDAFNQHDVSALMALVSEDCILETADGPDGFLLKGKSQVAAYWDNYFTERSGLRLKGEDVFTLGVRCIMRWRSEWTDASGAKMHIRGMDIFRVEKGLITEHFSYVKSG